MAEKNSLWKNIRANRGSGRKPTAEMLRQERKIKSQHPDGGPIKKDSYLNTPVEQVSTGSFYNPVSNKIYSDPNDPSEALPHEYYHAWQHEQGRDRIPELYDGPLKQPQTPYVDELTSNYYNRRGVEENEINKEFRSQNPSFNFVPDDVMYDKYTNDEMYNRPYTMEGEARATESPEGRAWLNQYGILPQGIENMYKATGGPVKENPLYKSNEDYVYNQWVQSLPENLREESPGYNLRGAWEGGLEPEYVTDDMGFHLGSRNPNTGEILKSPEHHTYDMAIEGDIRAGYTPRVDARTGKMYSTNSSDPTTAGPFKGYAKGSFVQNQTDQNTPTYSGGTLPAFEVVAEAPQWLKYKNEYEETNPKSSYVNKYLTPFARGLGNDEVNYPKRIDDEYNNKLYSSYTDKLLDDFSFEFTDKEQELVDKYSKTERDKQLYKFLKEKEKEKRKSTRDKWSEATGDITFDTLVDQVPDIAENFKNNRYVDKILKLPHLNKIKAAHQFLYEGKPLTAASELIKIPKASSIGTDALMNAAQENPTGYDLATFENKYLSPVRLASLKNMQIISQIGQERIASGETKDSHWSNRHYNLPDIFSASENFSKKYGVSQNDFIEFVENYMVGRNKSYKQTLDAYDKFLQSQTDKKATGGYFPTQGPPKALFKGYDEGGYMYPGGETTGPGGSGNLGYIKPTRQDSLMLFNNSLEKIKFYKNNPDYTKHSLDRNLREPNQTIEHTNFKDPVQRKAIIKQGKRYPENKKKVTKELVDRAIKSASDREPATPLEAARLKLQIGKEKFGQVPGTNLSSFGDVLYNFADDIYNPLAPPIYLHPEIAPQGSESYFSNRWSDSTDIPYYDPIAVAPFDMLTTAQKKQRVNKYGPTGVPQSYIDSNSKNKNKNIINNTQNNTQNNSNTPIVDRTPVQVDRLEPLKFTNLQTQETPLELSLKAPAKRKAAINRGANSSFDADGNPLVSEVNFGDGTGWHKVPYNTLDQYEEIKAQGGYTNPYNQYQDDPYLNYASGGYTYGKGGRTWKNIGAGAYGALEGLVDTTFGYIPGVDIGTDLLYKGLQKVGNSTEDEKREQDSIHGYAQTAGAVGSAILTAGATTPTAIAEGAQGLGQGISKGSETSDVARGVGTGLNIAGGIVGAVYGSTDSAQAAKEGFKLSEAGSQGLGKFAAASPIKGFSAAPKGTMQGVIDGNAVSMKPGTNPALSSVKPTASIGTFSNSNVPNINAPNPVNKIADVTNAISDIPKSQEPPPMAEPVSAPKPPAPQPQTDYNQFAVNPPTINTGLETPDYDFSYSPNTITFSQGGNMLNNSLNLRNTMRYKRFAQGGTFDQYGINYIPESAGLHHQSAYGGVPIGPNALAEGGEVKMDIGNGSQYIVSDQVDGAESQKDFTFSKGGKYKELNRTLADGMKQDLNKYTFGSLATSDRVKGDLRRPNDSYAQNTIDQIKQKWQEKTEYARKRTQQEQAIAQAEEQKRMAEEQYIAAYGGRINPKKYPGLNYAKGGIHIKPENKGKFTASANAAGHTVQEHARAVLNDPNATPLQKKRANFARNAAGWNHADGGYVYNPMTQPMLAEGGPIYGDPASEYVYAMGGMYGDPYYRGGQIDYTNDMYASGGPMVGNVPQAFKGPAAQNRGGMLMTYADGGMMPQEQQMMQEQQMQQQAPQEEMQQQPSQEQMMQAVQQAAQMLSQQMPPEQVMGELVKAGIPQEIAMQAVQMAMQEVASQMQQQGQEQPMQGQEQMMPPQGMAHGGRMYAAGSNVISEEEPPVIRKQRPKYYDDTDTYMREKKIFDDRMSTYRGYNDWNYLLKKTVADPNRPFKNHKEFGNWANSEFGKISAANPTYKRYAQLWQKPIIITHPDGSRTSYKTHNGIEPIDEPTLRMQELAALKAKSMPTEEIVPTINSQLEELPASVKMPTPKNVGFQTVNDSTQGVLAEDNPAFNYNPGWEVNFGDNQSWEKINNKESYTDPETKEVFPSKLHYLRANSDQYNITGGVPKSVDDWNQRWLNGEFDRNPVFPSDKPRTQATGGMMSPQDGMAGQVAQQLQQGAQPQQVLQKLIEQGMPQEQATAMVQAVMGQLKNQMQQQQMAPQQPMMAARGGYFNGRKQYSGIDTSEPPVFSPLADESNMSQIAGIGQSVIPALTSAYAFNKLSKRKLTPSLAPGVTIDYTPERINMMEESRRNLAAGINTMRNTAPTSGSYMGNVRGTILDANKLSGEQIAKSWQDQKNEQAKYDYQIGATNAGIRNQTNQTNEEMYQNAMQTGFEAAGNSAKNLASYYADKEDRNLQRWQAQNTVSENKYWTPKGIAHRDPVSGKYYIGKTEVDLTTGLPPVK